MFALAFVSQYVRSWFISRGRNTAENLGVPFELQKEVGRGAPSSSKQRVAGSSSQTSQYLQSRGLYSLKTANTGSDVISSTNAAAAEQPHAKSSDTDSLPADNVHSIDTAAHTTAPAGASAAETSHSSRVVRSKLTKSPNILIYTGKRFASSSFNEIKDLMLKCVGPNSYTIYHLKHDNVQSVPWQENCHLLIIAIERLYDGIEEIFIQYFSSGGNILSLCSNLDQNMCNLEPNDNPNTIQVVQTRHRDSVMNLVQGRCHYKSTDSLLPGVQLSPLANTTAGRTVVIEASNSLGGRCMLTQVHLERQPEQAIDPEMLSLLTQSEPLRQSMVRDVLQRLDLNLDEGSAEESKVTTCYIRSAGGQEALREFIQRVRQCHPSKITDDILSVANIGDIDLSEEACSEDVPLETFNWKVYKENLTSKVIGQILLYQRVAITTMNVVDPFIFCSPPQTDVVAIASRQLAAIGRGSNMWLSPLGIMAITLTMKVNINSTLGQRPALIQTIPAVAASRLVDLYFQKYVGDTPEIQIKVKWPNDIYYNGVKMGGVLVRSTIQQKTLYASVGVGVNVLNAKPTLNLNDVIHNYNAVNGTNIPDVSVEFVAARMCSEIELLADLINTDKAKYMDLYYKYWLHTGVRVDVPQQNVTKGLILGLDEYGFLKIQTDNGSTFSVQPDGNSFDIMHNMIKVKE